jgi:hypothetical protein
MPVLQCPILRECCIVPGLLKRTVYTNIGIFITRTSGAYKIEKKIQAGDDVVAAGRYLLTPI